MGENYVSIMDNYFDAFKYKMNNRFKIPKKLVEDYNYDICFMVACDKVYIQVVKQRIVWFKPLGYEVNIDDTRDIIKALLNEPIDPKAKYFVTYEESKAKIKLEIKLPHNINKGKKRIAKLKQTSSTLFLTEGKGDDIEEDDVEDEEKLEEVPVKKKGKVIITKPAKTFTAVFKRRASRKKLGKEVGDVIFKWRSPTFQKKL